MALKTAATNAVCSTTVPVGTQLHWCTVSRPLPGSVLWTGNVRDAGEVN